MLYLLNSFCCVLCCHVDFPSSFSFSEWICGPLDSIGGALRNILMPWRTISKSSQALEALGLQPVDERYVRLCLETMQLWLILNIFLFFFHICHASPHSENTPRQQEPRRKHVLRTFLILLLIASLLVLGGGIYAAVYLYKESINTQVRREKTFKVNALQLIVVVVAFLNHPAARELCADACTKQPTSQKNLEYICIK